MLYTLLIIILVLVSLCLVGVVLIQSGRGAGLSGAFGMGEGQAVFGSRTGDVLTKATEVFAIAFIVLCIAVTWQSKMSDESLVSGRPSGVSSSQRSTPLMSLEEAENLAKSTNQTAAAQATNDVSASALDMLNASRSAEDSAEKDSTGSTDTLSPESE